MGDVRFLDVLKRQQENLKAQQDGLDPNDPSHTVKAQAVQERLDNVAEKIATIERQRVVGEQGGVA